MLCRSSITAIKHLDKVTVCLWSGTKTRHKSFSKKKKEDKHLGKAAEPQCVTLTCDNHKFKCS